MRNNSLFPELWNGMDKFFSDSPFGGELAHRQASTFGAVDIEEFEDSYRLTLDVPGLSKDDVHIEMNGSDLRVWGERNEEKEDSHRGYHLKERRSGRFERTFHLGESANLDAVGAEFENGVLRVNIGKKVATTPRQIAIK